MHNKVNQKNIAMFALEKALLFFSLFKKKKIVFFPSFFTKK